MFRRRHVLFGLLAAAVLAPLSRMTGKRSPTIERQGLVQKDGWILRRDDLL